MKILIQEIPSHFKAIFFPPKNEQMNMTLALAALDRQCEARVARLAVYVFATMMTGASIILTEAAVITWSITLPALLVAFVAWAIFGRLNTLDEAYVDKLDDSQRSLLAKAEIERLLFHEKLEAFNNVADLVKAFENINRILGCRVFSSEFIRGVGALKKESANDGKTLYEAAHEQNHPLSIDFKSEEFERGWFGRPPLQRNLECRWAGQKEDEVIVKLQTKGI